MNFLIVPLFLITGAASAAIYDVGAGYARTRLSDSIPTLCKTSQGSPSAI